MKRKLLGIVYFVLLLIMPLSFGGTDSNVAGSIDRLPDTVFSKQEHAEESDLRIRKLLAESASLSYSDPSKSRPLNIKALELAAQGKPVSTYDHAYSLYLLFKNCYDGPSSSTFGPGTREDYLRVAQHLINLLDESDQVGKWVFTREGQFYLDAYVTASGGLAWYKYEDAKDDKALLNEALLLARKATSSLQNKSHYWAYDTEVRILLGLNHEDEAWRIVHDVQAEEPDFKDFRVLRNDARYLVWSLKNRLAYTESVLKRQSLQVFFIQCHACRSAQSSIITTSSNSVAFRQERHR